jgi:hypothetical protein
VIVTVTALLFAAAAPHPLETFTQYDVVPAGGTSVIVADVAPLIGLDVSPEAPRYHWYVSDEPVAFTESVMVVPGVAVVGFAVIELIAGGVQICVAVTVMTFELTVPPQFDKRA